MSAQRWGQGHSPVQGHRVLCPCSANPACVTSLLSQHSTLLTHPGNSCCPLTPHHPWLAQPLAEIVGSLQPEFSGSGNNRTHTSTCDCPPQTQVALQGQILQSRNHGAPGHHHHPPGHHHLPPTSLCFQPQNHPAVHSQQHHPLGPAHSPQQGLGPVAATLAVTSGHKCWQLWGSVTVPVLWPKMETATTVTPGHGVPSVPQHGPHPAWLITTNPIFILNPGQLWEIN